MEKLTAKQTASDLTEAEAIKQAQAGDAAAFEFLYKAHCRRVYSLCLRMIKNPAEAEDLTQQAFLQLFRKIGTFRGESGFSTWLHRVTVNIVLMHIRRHKPAEIPVEDLERTSPNGEGPREHGSSDTSMLGAIVNQRRRIVLFAVIVLAVAGCPKGRTDFNQGRKAQDLQDYDAAFDDPRHSRHLHSSGHHRKKGSTDRSGAALRREEGK